MPSENARLAQRLLDIVGNIDIAVAFVTDMTFEQFEQDQRTHYATLRALEIVSEASRHVPEDMQQRHPHIQWRAIQDAGNVYRHEYVKVTLGTVWQTVQQALSPLRDAAMDELGRLGYAHLVEKS